MQLTKPEIEKSLKIISRAWGRTQDGWCYFPYIDREEQIRTGIRRAGFHETKPFHWPEDREKIIDYLYEHQQYDVYWCPSLFEFPEQGRRIENAMDECALWADLDEVNPNTLTDYPPTVAWETSPGRYQCLWIINSGDIQGASWPGNENQRMTYMIGADASGWDTTQLLRLPLWPNHKPNYRDKSGSSPQGKILWTDGRTYQSDDFLELPEVQGYISSNLADAFEAEIDGVDRFKVIARVKLKLNKRARELLKARETSGDISESLWYLTRCLADVECSTAEIVAVVKETVWNKFRGRHDELHTLINEASKAIAKAQAKKAEKKAKDEIPEEDDEEQKPLGESRFGEVLRTAKKPKFLIRDLITEGACGFVAGEPKSFKSWIGLDLAISIATGDKFLNHFTVEQPGPVIYIQEEDPLPTLKARTSKIWDSKSRDRITVENGSVFWHPSENLPFDPPISAYIQQNFTVSDESWILWLDDRLAQGIKINGEQTKYKLVLIDTLMMTAGEVEENKSQEMTAKVFRPIKILSRKHGVTILFIHHMSKAEKARAGQRLLGSVANHAWAEDSLYLSEIGKKIRMELESKTVPAEVYAIDNICGQRNWQPEVDFWTHKDIIAGRPTPDDDVNWPQDLRDAPNDGVRAVRAKNNEKARELRDLLKGKGDKGMTIEEIAKYLHISLTTAKSRIKRFVNRHNVVVKGKYYVWTGNSYSVQDRTDHEN